MKSNGEFVSVTAEEFLAECTTYDERVLRKLIGCGDDAEDHYISYGQREFNNHLKFLKSNWYSVSKKDTEIITVLVKKYGGL